MIFKTEKRDLEVNGIKISAEVTIEVEEDGETNVRDDISFDNKELEEVYVRRFERGELFIGIISVTARAYGIEGLDILGGCHLCSNNAFNHQPFENSVNETVRDYSMVENALTELARNIREQAQQLKLFA
jgi:hypothetical protein